LQWLGDSLYVLDQRDLHQVLALDASGSIRDTLAVPDSLGELFAATPDGRELWFLSTDPHYGGRMHRLDRETGKVNTVTFAGTPGTYGLLGWANGAYYVATRSKPSSSPTIRRLNSDGTFTQGVELPADCIGLSLSRDGRRLVCSKTDQKSDIYLLRGVNLKR
jgi:hypothetical protein